MVGDTIMLGPDPAVTPGQSEAILCASNLPTLRGILDEAPLVAVVDEVTGSSSADVSMTGSYSGRYATLAAIIDTRQPTAAAAAAVAAASKNPSSSRGNVANPFKQSIKSCSLLGIGRSSITSLRFFSYDKSVELPVVIGSFEVLVDTFERDKMSPVHAITRVHDLAVRIGRVHDRRRRLVAGLYAAVARLERRRGGDDGPGTGAATTGEDGSVQPGSGASDRSGKSGEDIMSVDEFLSILKGDLINSEMREDDIKRVKSLDNWGVNNCLSSLADLSKGMVTVMSPFYSSSFHSTEMFYYEMFSFVAWRALKDYIKPGDVAKALQLRSVGDRLEIAYDKMQDHRLLLEKIAEELSIELLDCGEECTDLW